MYEQLSASDSWSLIGGKLGYIQVAAADGIPPRSGPQISDALRNAYHKILYPVEQQFRQSLARLRGQQQQLQQQQQHALHAQQQQGSQAGQWQPQQQQQHQLNPAALAALRHSQSQLPSTAPPPDHPSAAQQPPISDHQAAQLNKQLSAQPLENLLRYREQFHAQRVDLESKIRALLPQVGIGQNGLPNGNGGPDGSNNKEIEDAIRTFRNDLYRCMNMEQTIQRHVTAKQQQGWVFFFMYT